MNQRKGLFQPLGDQLLPLWNQQKFDGALGTSSNMLPTFNILFKEALTVLPDIYHNLNCFLIEWPSVHVDQLFSHATMTWFYLFNLLRNVFISNQTVDHF